jgi:hypothetical protein
VMFIVSTLFSGCIGVTAVNENVSVQKVIQVEVKKKPSDTEWTKQDTRTIDMLAGFEPDQTKIELDTYGGRTDRQVEATGFIYPKKIDGRWWLVDPDGHLFIHTAIVGVYTGLSDFGREKTRTVFGSEEKWSQFSAELLKKYGFNGSGGWSQADLLRKTTHPPVYTLSWDFMADFGRSKNLAWQVSGHKGYPDEVWPVFHPEFESFCDTYAQKLASTKDDPYCIGHFSDNELQMQKDVLDRTLKLDLVKYPEMKYNVKEAQKWLDARKGRAAGLGDITDQDRTEFIGYMFDRYFKLTTAAIRKYDSNHLCLGSRLHGYAAKSPAVFNAAGKYIDVVSVNYYRAWTPDAELMAMWVRQSGKPCMITEWYAKGADSGMPNNSGAGWLVKTQKDRALFYQNFSLGLMESKNCVGWHWFKYVDNDPNDMSVEPSNRDSNKGVVTSDYKPYTELLDEMKRLNDNVYPLIDYFDGKAKRSEADSDRFF